MKLLENKKNNASILNFITILISMILVITGIVGLVRGYRLPTNDDILTTIYSVGLLIIGSFGLLIEILIYNIKSK